MVTRLFDIFVALLMLTLTAPLMALAAVGIRLTSPGPILYRAQRVGRDGEPFEMYKFRTMHASDTRSSAITAPNDGRIFRFGAFLRKTKIDELPQAVNLLVGDMSVVGPRPESVDIVDAHYTSWMRETLQVKPGITSRGAIFNYLHGDRYLNPADAEASYVKRLMPVKLAIERAEIDRRDFARDIGTIVSTLGAILSLLLRRPVRIDPLERERAARWCGDAAFDGGDGSPDRDGLPVPDSGRHAGTDAVDRSWKES